MKFAVTYLCFALAFVLGIAFVLAANTEPYPLPVGYPQARAQTCEVVTVLTGSVMTGSPSFGIDQKAGRGERPLVDLVVEFTDADSSITQLDTTCTVSTDGNVTDVKPQSPAVSAGVATLTDGLTFQRAAPGTANLLIPFDIRSMPDFECTFTVGAGSADATIDVISVDVRMCTR